MKSDLVYKWKENGVETTIQLNWFEHWLVTLPMRRLRRKTRRLQKKEARERAERKFNMFNGDLCRVPRSDWEPDPRD